jgi:hypothetical protein
LYDKPKKENQAEIPASVYRAKEDGQIENSGVDSSDGNNSRYY